MSGLSHHPGKVAQGLPCREFESRLFRQKFMTQKLLDQKLLDKPNAKYQ